MKKILIFAVLASLASCRDQAAEMEIAKQNTIDSIQVVQEKQRIIDSMQVITRTEKEVIYVNNNSQPVTQKRKVMSNTAKGALIGAGVGAITGAAVSDKKGTGAIIGGLAGAGVGAGTGAIIDDKKNN